MRWLHRLMDHCYQVFTQRIQVNLVAQSRAEVRDNFGSIVFATVEAPIDDPLNAMSQGMEEGSDSQR